MFKILGADGKEYGPVADVQLRQWIREGRAGGTTQVRTDGGTGWVALNTLPDFADVFVAPPSGVAASGAVPPVVTTLAWAMFGVAGISALLLIVNLVSVLNIPASANFHLGTMFYVYWSVGALSMLILIVSGVGLLRGREWARRLAVWFAIIMTLYGAWGLVQAVMLFTHMADASFILRSPIFLLSHLWSLVLFVFNIATAVFLSRKDVRGAF